MALRPDNELKLNAAVVAATRAIDTVVSRRYWVSGDIPLTVMSTLRRLEGSVSAAFAVEQAA